MKVKEGLLVLFVLAAPIPMMVYGASTGSEIEPKGPPPGFHMMAMSGIASDDDALYVLAGGKILVYVLADLNEPISTVEIPKLEPPTDMMSKRTDSGSLPPPRPPMPPGSGLWVKNGTLYALAGPVIHVYKTADTGATPGLTYSGTFALPMPEPPKLSS